MTDISFLDYAKLLEEKYLLLRESAAGALSQTKLLRLEQVTAALSLWLSLAESIASATRDSDTPFWRFVRKLDYAAGNATSVLAAEGSPQVTSIVKEFATSSTLAERELQNLFESQYESRGVVNTVDGNDNSQQHIVEKIRARALADPRWAMRKYQVVESTQVSAEGRIYFPFTLNDAQEFAYGEFLDLFAKGENPLGLPFQAVLAKCRQMGGTEFAKQFAVYCVMWLLGYKVLFLIHRKEDAQVHLRRCKAQIERMHQMYPQIFPRIVRAPDITIELSNGSSLMVGYVKSDLGSLGLNFNLVILSEAGKYERVSPNCWESINQIIVPQVHAGPKNAIIRESTNDAMGKEFQRIVALAAQQPGNYISRFVSWTRIGSYSVAPDSSFAPSLSKDDAYADFILDDVGNRVSISEHDYMLRYSLSHGQLVFRRRTIERLGSLDLFHTEYPTTYEESIASMQGGFLPSDAIVKYETYARSFTARSILQHWSVWHDVDPYDEYSMAADFADGIPGGDCTVITIHRLSDGRQVAAARLRCNERDGTELMYQGCLLFGKKPYVIGELNNIGKAYRVCWLEYGYARNYHRPMERKSFDEYTDSMWFVESVKTREPVLLRFRTAFCSGDITFLDQRFFNDAVDFIKTPEGRYEAARGVSLRTGETIRDDYMLAGALAWEGLRCHPLRASLLARRTDTAEHLPDNPDTYGDLFSDRDYPFRL